MRGEADGSEGWYLTDHLGSVRDIADGAGAVKDHIGHSIFGATTIKTVPSYGDRLKHGQREYDPISGLYTAAPA